MTKWLELLPSTGYPNIAALYLSSWNENKNSIIVEAFDFLHLSLTKTALRKVDIECQNGALYMLYECQNVYHHDEI